MYKEEDFDIIKNNKYVGRRYYEFYRIHDYVPIVFTPLLPL